MDELPYLSKFHLIKFIEANRETIAIMADERLEENEAFRNFLAQIDPVELDETIHKINDEITPQIDCTSCGACCKSLMINVNAGDSARIAMHLNISAGNFEELYVEKSMEGQMIMKSMPCSFLSGTTCSVYEHRFNECREFPHLHKDNFKNRLFGTLIHYAICPIIYNVIEQLKSDTGFKI